MLSRSKFTISYYQSTGCGCNHCCTHNYFAIVSAPFEVALSEGVVGIYESIPAGCTTHNRYYHVSIIYCEYLNKSIWNATPAINIHPVGDHVDNLLQHKNLEIGNLEHYLIRTKTKHHVQQHWY